MSDPTTAEDRQPVALVVEDDVELAEIFAEYLEDGCRVRVATTGDEALEHIDHALDVALLDRKLGDWTGDELVNVIHERQIDCGIVMVTAVRPGVDIADLPVDEYLTKPILEAELQTAVEEVLYRLVGGADRRELLGLISRKIALEAELDADELASEPEYEKLRRRIAIAEERLDLTPVDESSKHRPEACPACELRWDVRVPGAVGYVEMGSGVWKCTRCGHVVNLPDSSDRWVAR